MVNIFSFFTGKKKSKRSASWTDAPTSTTANLVGNSSGTSTPAQQSVKRQTSRYLSLRTRSSAKMIDSPQNALHRQSSIGSLRRKASRRSTITTTLPKFGFEETSEDGGTKSFGKELGVSGSTLGLEDLVGLPKLRESEVDVVYAVELSLNEVKACWDLFGKALRDTGCDTVGLMLPQHTDPDPSTVHQLLALFLLHHQPSLAPSFPSVSAYAASQTPKPLFSDLLRNALNDRPHPHELCQILKFSLQHLTPSQTPLIDSGMYIKFVQAEHAATYPLDAYSGLYLPKLGAGVGECLNSIFEVIADIAIKSEYNMMSGGKVCMLLGWWLCGRREVEEDWQKVYKEWRLAGQRLEHLFYAWIRSQSTKSKLPTRLLELVENYPFGESTLSTDHLPLPPPSSFPRHTLQIHLESETKLSQLTPRALLESVLQAHSSSSPLLAKSQSLATEGETMNIDHIIQLESQAFLKRFSGSSSQIAPPMLRATPSATRLTIPASTSGRSMDSMAHPQLTPLLELSEELGTLASRHPASKPFQRSTSSTSTAAPKADWDDFSKLGFGDAPETATKLGLQLSPRDLPLPLSRSPSAVEPLASIIPTLKLKVCREERIEIVDAFLPFVEDSQLDKTNPSFNNIAFVRLSTAAALELSEESPIEWLLLSVSHRPPTPVKPITTLRSSSPSKESTTPRKRFSLGGLTSGFRRSSSMALRPDELKKSTGSKKGKGLQSLEEGGSGVVPTSKGLAVGEMGELLGTPIGPADLGTQTKEADDELASGSGAADPATGTAQIAAGTAQMVMASGPTADSAIEHLEERKSNHETPETRPEEAPTAKEEQVDPQEPVPGTSTTTEEPQTIVPSLDSTSIAKSTADQAVFPAPQNVSDTSKDPSRGSDISDWHYIAEGGANLVFGYHGRYLQFRNKALRIPKSPIIDSENEVQDISVLWRDELLPKLFSRDHLPDVQPVALEGKWVASLVEHVQHTRPDFRAEVDLSAFSTSTSPVKATLMDDLRTSSSAVSHTVLAIEIKPKWGFLPSFEHIHPEEAAAIKSQHSRYRLHQHLRGIETEYEPLDLYSDDMGRMATAMQALWGMWSSTGGKSNNWRVFVDGQAIDVTGGYKVPGVGESDDEATKTVPILSPILWHSGVMQRLRELQSTLDGTDISHLAQRFTTECPDSQLFDPTLLPQPSTEELRQFIDLYLSDPRAGKSDKWSLRESLIAYALSATFKDCSVFITCPLVSTSDGWKLDEPQATVKVIDLDLKPLANVRKWYDLDEKIWRHWHQTKSVDISKMDSQPDSQLATPAQITRSAIPSRLTSSSTEALYQPTPDRQVNDPMDLQSGTPSFGSVRAVSGQDASSTRALHSRTPEDSQPSTPKAAPTSTAETPASMSLSDALFISPSAAANQAATPASMSLSDALFLSPSGAASQPASPASMSFSDALFISPSAAITNGEHATPASMSFSDALFISPSTAMTIANENGRRGSNFALEESPMKDLNSHGHDAGLREEHDEEVNSGLMPDTPKRTTRSSGPSPSPGLVAAASDLPVDDLPVPADDFTFPPKSVEPDVGEQQVTVETEATSQHAMAVKPDPAPQEATSSAVEHQLAPIIGVKHDVEEEADRTAASDPVDDRATTPLADRQQYMRAVLAGVIDDKIPTSKSTEMDAGVPSTDSEEPSRTPPFVTPMTFNDDVEPTYPETNEAGLKTPTLNIGDDGTKPVGVRGESVL